MNKEYFLIEATSPSGSYSNFRVGQVFGKDENLKIIRIVFDHNHWVATKKVVYKVYALMKTDTGEEIDFLWQELEDFQNVRKVHPFPNIKSNEMLLTMLEEYDQIREAE